MAELVLNNEVRLDACPSELFALFGTGDPTLGWLFGGEAAALRPGALVRLTLPLGGPARSAGTARVLSYRPNRRIDLAHESPWAGRVVCRFEPIASGGTLVRVRITIDDGEVARLGAELGLLSAVDVNVWEMPLGLLASLSGSAGILGRSTVNCAQLAVDEINADGGVMGRVVRLVVADDSTDAGVGGIAMRRLCRIPGLAAIIGMHSSATYAVTGPMAIAEGIPYLYTPTSEPTLTHPLLVRFGETPSDQLHRALPRMAAQTGGSRWFLAGNDYSWPRAIGVTARSVIENTGGTVAGEGYLPLGGAGVRAGPVSHRPMPGRPRRVELRRPGPCAVRPRLRRVRAAQRDPHVRPSHGRRGGGAPRGVRRGHLERARLLRRPRHRREPRIPAALRRSVRRLRSPRFPPPPRESTRRSTPGPGPVARGGGVEPSALLSGMRSAHYRGPRRCDRGGSLRSLLLG